MLPAAIADAARESFGAATVVATRLGGEPVAAIAEAARSEFIRGIDPGPGVFCPARPRPLCSFIAFVPSRTQVVGAAELAATPAK